MQYTLIAAVAACLSLPTLAAVVATLAIRREERAWTPGGPAPGLLMALARRVPGFHADSVSWPQSRVNPVTQPSRCRRGRQARPYPHCATAHHPTISYQTSPISSRDR